MKHEAITERVIAAYYAVYNTLGWGFLEKVYHGAMALEMEKRGLRFRSLAKIDVYYEGQRVGEYYADFIVEECVILELKAADGLASEHEAQLLNYLKASNVDVGLLLNFGPKPTFKRKIFETARRGEPLNQSPVLPSV